MDFLLDQLPTAKEAIKISKILKLSKTGMKNKYMGSTQTFLEMLADVMTDQHIFPWAPATWTNVDQHMVDHFDKIKKIQVKTMVLNC